MIHFVRQGGSELGRVDSFFTPVIFGEGGKNWKNLFFLAPADECGGPRRRFFGLAFFRSPRNSCRTEQWLVSPPDRERKVEDKGWETPEELQPKSIKVKPPSIIYIPLRACRQQRRNSLAFRERPPSGNAFCLRVAKRVAAGPEDKKINITNQLSCYLRQQKNPLSAGTIDRQCLPFFFH